MKEYLDKSEIRRAVKKLKQELTAEEVERLSGCVLERVLKSPEYRAAEVIYTYYEYNTEVITHTLMEQALRDGKRVCLPLVVGQDMKFIEIKSISDVHKGYMGIPEPDDGQECDFGEVLMVMPGIAFDRSRNRIGYGGGFYDRYLATHKGTRFTKVALSYDFQVLDIILPVEEFDESVDVIFTPGGEIR